MNVKSTYIYVLLEMPTTPEKGGVTFTLVCITQGTFTSMQLHVPCIFMSMPERKHL